MKFSRLLVGAFLIFSGVSVYGQGGISGNMEGIFQYLNSDASIGAVQPKEKALLNSFINVNYRNSGFKAGVRMEGYLPRILGYPDRYDGVGLGYRYVGYENDLIDITVGNFYEQFGSGLIFRSYEDRNLGFDNAMDGIKIALRPYKGITLKTVYGRQRLDFVKGKIEKSDGIVRGGDLELNFNQWIPKLTENKWRITMGGSFVSKYQRSNSMIYNLPENVGAFGGRMEVGYKRFYVNGEYIVKGQDPSTENGYIFNYGKGLLLNAGYSQKGLGIILSAKSIDNMGFRSEREAMLQDVQIGFIPPLTKTHTYNLVSTLYPYASQPNGEVAFQADIFYTIPKKTKLGGKYGTELAFNFSTAYAPKHNTDGIDPDNLQRVMYKSGLFELDKELYWRDINFEIKKKIDKSWTLKASYYNISMNDDVLQLTNESGIIESHIGIIDIEYKINRKNTIRAELQGLWTVDQKDKGAWATALIEYTISPDWFFSFLFQSNYGNPVKEERINYPMVYVGKIWGATRVQVGYGRQKEGLFCAGGICRFVPASNGLTINVSHSF